MRGRGKGMERRKVSFRSTIICSRIGGLPHTLKVLDCCGNAAEDWNQRKPLKPSICALPAGYTGSWGIAGLSVCKWHGRDGGIIGMSPCQTFIAVAGADYFRLFYNCNKQLGWIMVGKHQKWYKNWGWQSKRTDFARRLVRYHRVSAWR